MTARSDVAEPAPGRSRCAIYTRVSSVGQRDRDTIVRQLTMLPAWIACRGLQLVRPATTYMDNGISARTGSLEKLASLQRIIGDASEGHFDVIVIEDYDRLSRSEEWGERELVLGALARSGAHLYVARDDRAYWAQELHSGQWDLALGELHSTTAQVCTPTSTARVMVRCIGCGAVYGSDIGCHSEAFAALITQPFISLCDRCMFQMLSVPTPSSARYGG